MTRVTINNHLDDQLTAMVEHQVDLSIRAVEDTLRSVTIGLNDSPQNSLRILCQVEVVMTNGSNVVFDVEDVNAETAVRDALERVRREARRSRALRVAS